MAYAAIKFAKLLSHRHGDDILPLFKSLASALPTHTHRQKTDSMTELPQTVSFYPGTRFQGT